MSNATSPNPDFTHLGGAWTAREIHQQPAVWRDTVAVVAAARDRLQGFLNPLLARPNLRIVLTGAGSSAYLGQCLQPELLAALGRRVEAIATTDLVAGPEQYFQRGVPTLLVSFARSGNSPESLAAVDLAERFVDDCHHLVITCNGAGALYERTVARPNGCAILLPEATHDRGFAMTSSFSSMLYAAWLVFAPDTLDATASQRVKAAASFLLETMPPRIDDLVARRFARTVYLGSCGLAGLASEAALKLLELTDGAVAAISNSPLGFRHGPKTFLTRNTLVVTFLSNNPLTRRYDLDLARELKADGIAGRVLVLSAPRGDLDGLDALVVPGLESAGDAELAFAYLVVAQLYAFQMSIALGCTPDNPSASGAVNRVVKGVTIYPAGD